MEETVQCVSLSAGPGCSINYYLADSMVYFLNTYPLDSDLSSG